VVEALAGIRIIEFGRHLAVPMGTQMLSDFGAEVIKVESPHGDPSRRTGNHRVHDVSALYLNWNHGKRSIALDLRSPEGLATARKLCDTADVVVENYRPGVADEIGIGYEALSASNPGLIYCSVSAFGELGPWANQPGTDPCVQALSGVMYVTGEPDGRPMRVGTPTADFVATLFVTQGILLGLAAREKIGEGQRIDVSMFHAMIASLSTRAASYWATGSEPGRCGTAHSEVVPYETFQASDGWVMAGTWAESSWAPFCRAVDRSDLVDDPRFRTNADRYANRVELLALLADIFITRSRDEWQKRFLDAKALFAPVLSVSEALTHPQADAIPVVEKLPDPDYGHIPHFTPVVRMSKTPGHIRSVPPRLGQHTDEVLAELKEAADSSSSL
jgi:formyl-CoA transferase/CoA:oxalate CoA-transferase